MPACKGCGTRLERYQTVCPQCSTPVGPPGFFRQAWEGFLGLFGERSRAQPRGPIRRVESRTVEIVQVGEPQTYSSLEEMPPEIRAQVEQALRAGGGGRFSSSIVIEDESGRRQEYSSWDEVPAEVRRRLEALGLHAGEHFPPGRRL